MELMGSRRRWRVAATRPSLESKWYLTRARLTPAFSVIWRRDVLPMPWDARRDSAASRRRVLVSCGPSGGTS